MSGGRTDDVLSLVVNVFLIMPSLPLLIVLAAFLPPGHATIVLVLTVTGWAWPARVLRAQTLALREKDFVIAAEMLGETRLRIVFVEILPNMLSIVAASFVGSVVYGIGAQAGARIHRPRRHQRGQLGHQPVLGGEQLQPADRGVVDFRALRRLHRHRRLRLLAAELRDRRADQPAPAVAAQPPQGDAPAAAQRLTV